jgi:Polyphosphate kinase N-terminal domain
MEEKRYLNRDLSWLEFNCRVLREAQDEGVPLLERVKFLAIFSSCPERNESIYLGVSRGPKITFLDYR